MTNFDKALEEKAIKHSSQYEQLGQSVFEAAEFDFKAGARWARDLTIFEVIKFVRHYGYFNVADAIAVNFKDRGGE